MSRKKTGRALPKLVNFRMTEKERNELNKFCKDNNIALQDFLRGLVLNILKGSGEDETNREIYR